MDEEAVPKRSDTLHERLAARQRSLRLYGQAQEASDRRWAQREASERGERFREAKRMTNSNIMAPRIMLVGPGYDQKLVKLEGWQ